MKKKFIVIITIFLGVFSTFIYTEYSDLYEEGIIVLLYHKILEDTHNSYKYTVSLEDFRKQLDYLTEQRYTTVLPRGLAQVYNKTNFKKTVILSFDDGTEDHYNTVYEELKTRNLNGLFFVVTKYIDRPDVIKSEQIIEMSNNGMEFGSHSHTHRYLDELENDEVLFELSESKATLEKIIGNKVTTFAPPGGWFDNRVVEISQKVGFNRLYSCEIGTNNIAQNPYIFKRIEVLGTMTQNDFKDLLNPPEIIMYKTKQSIKFIVHDILGSEYYSKIASFLN